MTSHFNILKIGLINILLIASTIGFAQQLPQFNQYMFNPLGINPAYAGSRETLSAVLLHRSQWVGFSGAPQTQTFSINSPLKNKNMGVGFQVLNDKIGPNTQLSISGDYAYRIKLWRGKLAFGLRAGLSTYKFNFDKIDYKNKNDLIAANGNVSSTLPNFDFGMYYNSKTFYAGIESANLNRPRFALNDSVGTNATARLYNQLTITVGKAFVLSNNIVFKPSILLKSVEQQNGIIDLNASFLFYKSFWAGVSLRSKYGVILIFEYQLKNGLRVGYSYDYTLNDLGTTQGSSHEIMVGYDINIFKSKMISPRYF